ncbi:MAG: GTPase HflX [Melioribacteraceae bacterium]|nr:GTPase HflX [Melioribacteraceae bacterium]MCF8355013.1 GTPase HflX [Melioribacteraceae bacterium]MCF8394338.1 GTPase HflX [Melioribacteraceae bacterium]MCF8420017.1 GTPase HflX [Melioribacteraceae bacterium]
MEEIQSNSIEKALLVTVKRGTELISKVEEHLDELEMLADTAGAQTLFKVIQDRSKIDPAFFIGKGKAEEIAQLVELNDIQLVIFDEDLNPTQVRNLEKLIDRKILDRSGLILDIFASHARTNEAKTQVELAQLQYMLPRLTRAWTHLSKQYGGIGTKGPGETQIETDRRIIRTRISKLKEKLRKIESQQITKSIKRKDFIRASLVGYTNAGKSTLLNRLTDAGVLTENKLFATLDSTTRSFELDKNKKILISDTVGFIRKLPHNLIASFKSTLNVVRDADVVLHVIDVTHPFFEDHMYVVDETLKELDSDKKAQIKIFNKVDALEDRSKIEYVLNKYPNSLAISAERGMNIGKLNDKLIQIYEENFVENKIQIPNSESKIISKIHDLADVLKIEYEDNNVNILYRTDKPNNEKIMGLVKRR